MLRRLLAQMKTLLPVLFVFFGLSSIAQQRTITGRITDARNNAPIQGASVVARGTNRGTSTDADGNFSLTVDNNTSMLVITSVGYTTQETVINGNTVAISLIASNSALNEVVVVG